MAATCGAVGAVKATAGKDGEHRIGLKIAGEEGAGHRELAVFIT